MDVDNGSAIGAYIDLIAERMPPGVLVRGQSIVSSFGDWSSVLDRPFLVDGNRPCAVADIIDPKVRAVICQMVDELTSSNLVQISRYPDCDWGVRGRRLPTTSDVPDVLLVFIPAEDGSERSSDPWGAETWVDDSAPVLIWETEADGAMSYVSPTVLEYTGRGVDELVDNAWAAAIHPDDRLRAVKTSGGAHREKKANHFTCRIGRYDGRYFEFFNLGLPRHDKSGRFLGFRGFAIPVGQSIPRGHAIPDLEALRSRLLDCSPLMTSYLSSDLRYVAVNQRYAQFWGKTPQAIIGRRLDEITGEFYGLVSEKLKRALQGEPVSYQLNVHELGTETSWLDVTHMPAVDEDGQIVGVYCFVKDISRAYEREALLQMVLNHAPAHIMLIDGDQAVRYVNNSLIETFGLAKHRIVGRSFQSLVGRYLSHDLTPLLRRSLDGEHCRVEVSAVAANGTSVELLVNLVPHVENGVVTSVCGMMVDTTELKLAEEKLRHSEARYELAVKGSSVAVWEYEPGDDHAIYCDEIERLLGYARGELGNSRAAVRELIHPEDRRLNDAARQLSLDGIDAKVEMRMKTRSGHYRWYSIRSRIQHDSEGQLKRIAGTLTDVHDLKMAQLRAAQQVRQRDQFLAMLSHELRNPLTAIMFALNCLNGSSQVDDEAGEMVQIISRQAIHMKRLLSDLLDVARITNNRINFERALVDLRELVRELLPSVEPGFAEKSQVFQYHLPEEPVMIHADGVRIKQVVGNLLENARKYTPDKGRINLSLQVHGERAVVRVEDNGVGINDDDLDVLFDLFYQVEQTKHREIGGMGVGLFLAKKIMEFHQGRIFVESRGLNQGSCFGFEIPLSLANAQPDQDEEAAQMGKLRIALVEDNQDALWSLERLMKSRGCQVDTYETGDQAVLGIPKRKPNVAVIDIGLPGKDGMQVARELRQRNGMKSILLIALTGYGQQADRDACLAAGFDDYMVKPVDFESLCRRIQSHLAQRALPRSA